MSKLSDNPKVRVGAGFLALAALVTAIYFGFINDVAAEESAYSTIAVEAPVIDSKDVLDSPEADSTDVLESPEIEAQDDTVGVTEAPTTGCVFLPQDGKILSIETAQQMAKGANCTLKGIMGNWSS